MLFLTRLMPRLIAFALDLAALDMDDDEIVDWRDERDDFVDDFVKWEGISEVKKKR